MFKKIDKQKPREARGPASEPRRVTAGETAESSTERRYTRQELRSLNTRYIMRKDQQKERERVEMEQAGKEALPILNGLLGGLLTWFVGLGSACIAANPVIQAIGGVVVVGSILYGLSRFFS